jgi:GTP-binding protein
LVAAKGPHEEFLKFRYSKGHEKMEVRFLKSAFVESHYPPPDKPEVAFAGRSNVGKSSLINTLVHRKKLAKTSATPGRTQALNFFSVADRFYLVDLPGYGYAVASREAKKSWQSMIETYLLKRDNLKAVVVILDIRRDPNKGDMELIRWLREYRRRVILVLTKSDKLSRRQAIERTQLIRQELKAISEEVPTVFSAKTREGREEIWGKIIQAAGIGDLPVHTL